MYIASLNHFIYSIHFFFRVIFDYESINFTQYGIMLNAYCIFELFFKYKFSVNSEAGTTF